MNGIVKTIGSIIMAAILCGAFVLATCAVVYKWPGFVTTLLVTYAVIEFIALVRYIRIEVEE